MSNTSDTATMRATEQEAEAQTTQPQSQGETTAQTAQDKTTTTAANETQTQPEPKPDVSDKSIDELLPMLSSYFHNNREELGRALGVHRSTVDRWFSGKSRPNNSTLLRMRRVVQERRIE